jgi:hypothetical protein
LATLVVALAATASPALAQKHRAPAKPDLTIEDAVLKHPAGAHPFVIQKQRDPKLFISDRTVNAGTAAAGRTVTKVYLEHDGKRKLLAKRKVAPLRPGETDFGNDVPVDTMNFPLGAYTAVICADANHAYPESTRKPQCARADELDFIVAAARWEGSVGGTYNDAIGAVEQWSSTDAVLKLEDDDPDGNFVYGFTGKVTWTDSGTDDAGCVWDGSGSKTFTAQNRPLGQMTIDYQLESYTALFSNNGVFFKTNVSCPGGGHELLDGPQASEIWGSGVAGDKVLPFGSTTLPGSPTAGSLATTFRWSLHAAGP